MKYRKPLALAIALLIVFLASAWAYNRYLYNNSHVNPDSAAIDASDSLPAPVEGVEVGDIAYDFTLSTFAGEEVTLSDYRGKIVVLNFWGTWCGSCLNEMAAFQAIQDDLTLSGADADTVILSVNLLAESRVSSEETKAYLDEQGFTFLVLSDTASVAFQYSVFAVPQTFILNKDGIITGKIMGYTDQESIIAEIEGARA